MYTDPLAFLLTFTTYGTWLHGTKKGSVDVLHNKYGGDFIEENIEREQEEFAMLKCEPIYLTPMQREAIESAMREACEFRQWTLHEINVRTNHVHVVVTANEMPKKVIEKLKSRATMAIRSEIRDVNQSRNRKVAESPLWTRGGSGRYLWNEEAVQAACEYVRNQDKQQSKPESEPRPEGRESALADRKFPQPSGCGSDSDSD